MAQNNIEKEFRDKLNLREITPSPAAWDRLDAMLTVAEQKKTPKSFLWIYIAAACVVIMLVSTIFFRQAAIEQPTDQIEVVVQPKPQMIDRAVPDVSGDRSASTAVAASQIPTTNQQKHPVSPSHKATKTNAAIADRVTTERKTEQHNASEDTANTQVEQLLASATTSPDHKKLSVKVDPNSLLLQVDGEIELSFREKVIKSAGKNFQNVKVALANRNLQ